MDWSLHPKLSTLTSVVGDLPLSRVLLENDSSYPWLILVPRKASVSEIIDLNAADQAQLLAEINAASHALRAVATFDKLNVAALGNVVAQLHVHVLGRRTNDPTWPKPVFGLLPPVPYEPAALAALLEKLRRELAIK
jgi:diadenosine tetraphosphate (Ap4A) HIT family hydrolase